MSWRILIIVMTCVFVGLISADSPFICNISIDDEATLCFCESHMCFKYKCCLHSDKICAEQLECTSEGDMCGYNNCKSINKTCLDSHSTAAMVILNNCLTTASITCNSARVNCASLPMAMTTTSAIHSTSYSASLSSAARSSSSEAKTSTITSPQQTQKNFTTGNQSDIRKGNQQPPIGVIIGAVVGCLLGIALLVGLLVLLLILCRRRHRFTSSKMDKSATTSKEASGYGSPNCTNRVPLAPYDNIGSSPVSAPASDEASGYSSLHYVSTDLASSRTSSEAFRYGSPNCANKGPLAPYDNIGLSPASQYPPVHAESCSDNVKVQQNQDSVKGFSNVKMADENDQLPNYEEAMKVKDNIGNAYETVAGDNRLHGGHAMKASPAKPDENETILIENDLYQR